MPFTDEPEIETVKSSIKRAVLSVSIGLFISSLFFDAYCTEHGCKSSLGALLLGWFGMLLGGSGLVWIANPLLFTTWMLLARNKRSSWVVSFLASVAALSFLFFHNATENEAGHFSSILKVGFGYWLWLSSCLITLIGSLAIRFSIREHIYS